MWRIRRNSADKGRLIRGSKMIVRLRINPLRRIVCWRDTHRHGFTGHRWRPFANIGCWTNRRSINRFMVSRSRDVVRWRCGGRRKKLISYFGCLGKCLLFPCSTVVFFRNRGIVTLAFGTLTVSTRRTSTASNFSKGMLVSTFPTVNPILLTCVDSTSMPLRYAVFLCPQVKKKSCVELWSARERTSLPMTARRCWLLTLEEGLRYSCCALPM